MKKMFGLVGIGLLIFGSCESFQTLTFLSRATHITGTVVSVETRSGPPKPSQDTPVHVRYTLEGEGERVGITHLPLLHRIKEGETIRLLVDPTDPQSLRLPLLSELWARPLTCLVGGLLLLGVSILYSPQWVKGKSRSAPG